VDGDTASNEARDRIAGAQSLPAKTITALINLEKRKFVQVLQVVDYTHPEFVIKAKNTKCHYCDRQASGLDRVKNSEGHTKANCVPACVRCNWVRGSWLSYETMLEVGNLLKRIDP
jgi:hypothetical protein